MSLRDNHLRCGIRIDLYESDDWMAECLETYYIEFQEDRGDDIVFKVTHARKQEGASPLWETNYISIKKDNQYNNGKKRIKEVENEWDKD